MLRSLVGSEMCIRDRAMRARPGAVQMGRLGTCRHHSVHSMQGSSVRARAAAWNSIHTVQHWLHWAMVWLQEGESLVSCSSTKAATIATTADANVHRVLLHIVLLLCLLLESAGRRRRPSGLGGLATTRVGIWLRLREHDQVRCRWIDWVLARTIACTVCKGAV